MNPAFLRHKKSGWERMPDVVSNLPRVLNSSLVAVEAARTALDSTMNAVDAAKAGSKVSRPAKPEKSGGRSSIRGGLIAVGSAVAIGLGSAAVSSLRQRQPTAADARDASQPAGSSVRHP
jgi:hypothetical protein